MRTYGGDTTAAVPVANPKQVELGSLVCLWAPEQDPWRDGTKPITARVDSTTVHSITGTDVRDGAHAVYHVGDPTPGAPADPMTWRWEVIGEPETTRPTQVEVMKAADTVEGRARFVVGDVGNALRVSLSNGEIVHGILTKLVMGKDDWEAEWAELVDSPPGRDVAVHVIRVADVSKVTRYRHA
jgi:hypothetical protein